MTILRGLLVDLVPFTREFVEQKMHEYWNNESRLWATMGEVEPVTRDQIKRISEHRAEGRERGYTGVHFMMCARDGSIIGTMDLNWVDYWNRVAWLGAWIGEEDYWGGGHGTDGLLLLAEYAFGWFDMRRLALGTMDINQRAQRNVEKCGFRLESRGRRATLVNGLWVDSLEYGMLREEWRGRDALVEELGLREKAELRYGKMLQNQKGNV
jgi:RimJ/RimL family protein N-acetyltransferase